MQKTLITNESEYRQFVFQILEDNIIGDEGALEDIFGVIKIHECWDTDENGNEIDEDGNILPDDSSSPEKLVFQDWVKNISFPFVIVSWIDVDYGRGKKNSILAVEFVELKDFENDY
jgi:hypothetical protein